MTNAINEEIKLNDYFKNRNIETSYYDSYIIPKYLKKQLPAYHGAKILDIGCGFGQFLSGMKKEGYTSLKGIDISNEALAVCREKGIETEQITDIITFAEQSSVKYDFITMSHVLEHIEKEKVIETLTCIRKYLLAENGSFIVMVPNAQSHTGAYWMYEDFTHHTLFTAGSLSYVLAAAGFEKIHFLNADGTDHMKGWKKIIIKSLLKYYKKKQDFWNFVTQSSFHKPSPRIYSFELKVIAK